jgi:hypothetical protein
MAQGSASGNCPSVAGSSGKNRASGYLRWGCVRLADGNTHETDPIVDDRPHGPTLAALGDRSKPSAGECDRQDLTSQRALSTTCSGVAPLCGTFEWAGMLFGLGAPTRLAGSSIAGGIPSIHRESSSTAGAVCGEMSKPARTARALSTNGSARSLGGAHSQRPHPPDPFGAKAQSGNGYRRARRSAATRRPGTRAGLPAAYSRCGQELRHQGLRRRSTRQGRDATRCAKHQRAAQRDRRPYHAPPGLWDQPDQAEADRNSLFATDKSARVCWPR